MKRSEIWLGDLLRAFAKLQPRGEQEVTAIARMLKLDRSSTAIEAVRLQGVWGPAASPKHRVPPSQKVHLSREDQGERALVLTGDSESSAETLPETKLIPIRIGGPEISKPYWVSFTTPLARPVNKPLASPSPPPLIKKRVRRAILSAALATRVPDGPPDVDRIFQELTKCRPLAELPRLLGTTLRQGVQVLVDGWIGMAPFSVDQQGLLEAIRRIIAPDRFEVLRFAGCPIRGVGTGSRTDWGPWKAPPPFRRVVVLSDLGIGGPLLDRDRANISEWLEFAKQVRDARCPFAALVPYEPARWPKELANSITLIHWSERLTAGAIRRAFRRGACPKL